MEYHPPWDLATGNGEKVEEEAEVVVSAVLDHVVGAAVEASWTLHFLERSFVVLPFFPTQIELCSP